jgi:hypothetical protein
MKEITNLTSRALPLADGTVLAARGTDGCCKQVTELSDADAQRLGDRIFVREVGAPEVRSQKVEVSKGPDAGAKETAK